MRAWGIDLSAISVIRAVFVKRRIASVEIFGVEIVLRYADGIGEALIMHYFTGAQEFYYVINVGIVGKAQDIVIGCACLLLCCNHVFATFLLLIKTAKSLDL